jgi:AraC family transcriptional regulator, transcriptional activator of pobA
MFKSYYIADFLDLPSQNKYFHINRLEDMPPLPTQIITPHKHHFYELFLVRTGNATHKVDYEEYQLKADNFFLISQGQLHFWAKTDRENIKGYRLMFTEDFLLMWMPDNQFLYEIIHLDNIYQNPLILLSKEDNSLIYSYFDLIFQEYTRQNSYEKSLQSLLFLLLAEVHRLFEKQSLAVTTKHNAVIFKQFLLLLEKNYEKKWLACDYADALFLSSRHLNRIVQSMTNQSISIVIQNRTILEAKRLLTFSDLNINQIAAQLGFEDAAYFSRFFLKVMCCTPKEFKMQMSEKYQ